MTALDLTPAELAAVRRFGLDKPEATSEKVAAAVKEERSAAIRYGVVASTGSATEYAQAQLDTDAAIADALAAVPAPTLAVVEEAIKRADREQMDGLSTRSLLREVVQTGEMPDTLPVPAPETQDGEALQARVDEHMQKLAHRVMDVFEEAEDDASALDVMPDVFAAIGLVESFTHVVPVSPEGGE